jgi:hypothetical protein
MDGHSASTPCTFSDSVIRILLSVDSRSHQRRTFSSVEYECWVRLRQEPVVAPLAAALAPAAIEVVESALGNHGEAYLIQLDERSQKLALATTVELTQRLLAPLDTFTRLKRRTKLRPSIWATFCVFCESS